MSALPAPFPVPADDLARLVDGLEPHALWWLSGYAAALAQQRAPLPRLAAAVPPAPAPLPSLRATVLYGSQTGNARRVAEQLVRDLEAGGVTARLVRADVYPTRELASERLLFAVVSTQGEGDPPDDALGFVEFLAGKRAPRLPQLDYAVLGLGDSSYPQFNAIGRKLDARFAELGARRLFAAGEADVDIDTVAAPWRAQALTAAREATARHADANPESGVVARIDARGFVDGSASVETRAIDGRIASVTPLRAVSAESSPGSREHPFAAEVLANQRITARGSRKDVRHLELSLAGSGIAYQPGDALGVWHRNPDALVDAVLQAAGLDADDALRETLASGRELTRLARPFLAAHAQIAGSDELRAQLDGNLAGLLASHQLIDVLRRWPAAWEPAAFLAALRPLAPRLYSIASSPLAVGEEAHLTLDVLQYEAFGTPHGGAASRYLADLAEGDSARVYLEPNERFRLPADGARDIVMIGPGTGVAPFRGFVQERAATGARGRNWLLFGNPHFRSDFLYQLEWQAALKAGTLHELDLAFSRDGAEKVYVQHRLAQRGAQLHAWLDGGAHLYVCGAVAMGKDVHAALRAVVARERAIDDEAAEAWLRGLQREGRYARDVY